MKTFSTIAADAMVLMSAATGGAAARVFQRDPVLSVVTTDSNVDEALEHLPRLVDRMGLDPDLAAEALASLPLTVYARKDYESHLEASRELIERRDPDDVPLLALALTLQIPIWSNDHDFDGLSVKVYPTAVLLKILESEGA